VAASEGGRGGGGWDPGARGVSTGGLASGGHRSGRASGVGTPWELEERPSGRSWGRNSGALWGRGSLTEGAGD